MKVKKVNLGANDNTTRAKAPTFSHRVVKKSISQVQRDIADWKYAIRLASLAVNPKFYLLQDLYDIIDNDALLSSQINNRHEISISTPFELVTEDGKVDDQATVEIRNLPFILDIFDAILKSEAYGYNLGEFYAENGIKHFTLIPRQNVDPVNGRFYPDYSLSKYIEYRTVAEYNKWIIEFNSGTIGLLNKSVLHVLFKKFAQSCWSELCEIFGIPPRYIKTNTQDDEMLTRAEVMLKEMGAAASFVIDTEEEFAFAQGIDTNGDVYNNLIRLCNNENSMLWSGAVLGQDTENGNRSKEEVSVSILDRLINSDMRTIERYMNNTVIPALIAIGWLKQTNSKFRFSAVEDSRKLWEMVTEVLPYKDVDNDFITEKFGIPVKDKDFSGLSNPNLDFFV